LKAYEALAIIGINSFWSIPRLIYVGDFKCGDNIFNSDHRASKYISPSLSRGGKDENMKILVKAKIWGGFGASDCFAET